MDLSNLNPKNWFRRESPKPVQASPAPSDLPSPPPAPQRPDHLPKYKKGQHCLVLKTNGKIKMGTEVVLTKAIDNGQRIDLVNGIATNPKAGPVDWYWYVDKSYPIPQPNGTTRMAIMPESWLMPLDDETIAEYLTNEVLDEVDQRMSNFAKMLDQFDVMLKAYEQELKSRGV